MILVVFIEHVLGTFVIMLLYTGWLIAFFYSVPASYTTEKFALPVTTSVLDLPNAINTIVFP